MFELGNSLREEREDNGVSIKEVSEDLNIKEVVITNIESGNIGAFKDIFELKNNIYSYSKYLGLNPDKVIDEFNECLFEYTSKIPLKDIEKQVQELNAKNVDDLEMVSPYTKVPKKHSSKFYYILYTTILIIVIILIVLCVREITIRNNVTNAISYIK